MIICYQYYYCAVELCDRKASHMPFVHGFVCRLFIVCLFVAHCVDISPSSQPDRALSALSYWLKTNFNLSQLHHVHMPIACAHTGNSNTHLRQVSYRNLLRSQYEQGCNQCEQSDTQVHQNLNAHQLHLNAPYKHISAIVSTSPVGRTN
jgi:hypothetical protein